MNIDAALRFLGEVVIYGGGSAAAAYLLFQFLGKSWIESKFAEKLELLRHSQAQELQRLRVEIDSILSGAIKLQEKEFETLPEAWLMLDTAYGNVASLVHPYQESPDLNRYNDVALEEFLADSVLKESQKQEIRIARDKTTKYVEVIFWYRLNKVNDSIRAFHNFIARNSVFFPPELKAKFKAVSSLLWEATVSKKIGHQAQDWKMQDRGWDKVKDEVEPMKNEIEEEIYQRLQSHAKGAGAL